MAKKILIVFGTRPEIIKLAPLIHLIKNSELRSQCLVVSTSQHDELLDQQLDFWEIKPDYFLTSCPFKKNLTRLLSHTINGIQDVLDQEKDVEYIIVQGDTNTALACANLAFLNQLKLIHIEAGLRSYDLENPFPEEFNRIVTTKAAYFHFAPTELSKKNLIAEGIEETKIQVVGNTVIDALNNTIHKTNSGKAERKTVLITLHRRENIESNYIELIDVIECLAKKYPELHFLWIAHPNSISNISTKVSQNQNIEVCSHLPYDKFISLYNESKIVITDSGGVTEEVIQLGIPVIVFRVSSERTEPIELDYPMIISINKEEILSHFDLFISIKPNRMFSYGNGKTSEVILKWLIDEIK